MSKPRIALLVCDAPISDVLDKHGDYQKIFTRLLAKSLPSPSEFEAESHFTLDPYDVRILDYPKDEELASYNGVIITGSGLHFLSLGSEEACTDESLEC